MTPWKTLVISVGIRTQMIEMVPGVIQPHGINGENIVMFPFVVGILYIGPAPLCGWKLWSLLTPFYDITKHIRQPDHQPDLYHFVVPTCQSLWLVYIPVITCPMLW